MTTNPKHLSALNTNWHNCSRSSIVSEATTFHSTHAQMELSQLETLHPRSPLASSARPSSPEATSVKKTVPAKSEGTQMARQDSGYSDGMKSSSSRRASTSTTSTHRQSKRLHTSTSTSTPDTRPSTKRATRSSSAFKCSSSRPNLHLRHTTPYPSSKTTTPYEFFQFPVLQDPSQNVEETVAAPPPPPPTTCQYWNSDSTRRLEYAAIDAAGKGLRGFVVRLLPDCVLPVKARRTKFHNDGGDADSDTGSVRRYRIPLVSEEKRCSSVGQARELRGEKAGLLKRLTSFGRDR